MEQPYSTRTQAGTGGRIKFVFGGVLILAAVIYLIVSSSQANAQYFLTVNELKANPGENMNRSLRISGAVVGDTIQYDSRLCAWNLRLRTSPATMQTSKPRVAWQKYCTRQWSIPPGSASR